MPAGERMRAIWYAIGCLAAGAGILVKGPIAIAIPTVAVAGARLLEGRGRSLVSVWTVAALALALLPIGVWLVAAGRHVGWGYPEQIVVRHALEHALGRVNHAGRPWDYLRIFPAAFLPGILLLPAALLRMRWRRPLPPGDALPAAWFLGGLVLLSLLPVKRHHYLMPLYPGAALLVAGLFRTDAPPKGEPAIVALLGNLGRLGIAALGAAAGLVALSAALAIGVQCRCEPGERRSRRACGDWWRPRRLRCGSRSACSDRSCSRWRSSRGGRDRRSGVPPRWPRSR